MLKVYICNPPTIMGFKFNRESRCNQRTNIWGTNWPPITLAYIGTLLKNEKLDVYIRDWGAISNSFYEAIKDVINFVPDILIMPISTTTIESDLKFLSNVKFKLPYVKTIIYGSHATYFCSQLIKMEYIDYIVLGEPELRILKICETIMGRYKDLSLVDGVVYKKNGNVKMRGLNKDRFIDLDKLPIPAWDLIDINKYKIPFVNEKFLIVTPSRGCPYRCIFCLTPYIYGNNIRYRSPKSFVNELEYLVNKYKVVNFLFWSETFTLNKEFVLSICKEIRRRKIKIKWYCSTRADKINTDIAEEMRKSGCRLVSLGIESGSRRILKICKKNLNKQTVVRSVNILKDNKIEVLGHFILGLPGETKRGIIDTKKFINKLKLDYLQVYLATPFPGTELYEMYRNSYKEGDFLRISQVVFGKYEFNADNIVSVIRYIVLKFYLKKFVDFNFAKKVLSVRGIIWTLRVFIELISNK
ncbi:MAG: B12-binding domain-containing radical SAM protein [Promethearchaeota archaeon]